MNSAKNLFVATALFAAVAIPTSAIEAQTQTASRSGYYSLGLGNAWMGGSLFVGSALTAQRTPDPMVYFRSKDYGFAALNFDAQVRFLQHQMQLASMSVSARSQNYGTSLNDGSFSLNVRGLVKRSSHYTTAGTHTPLHYYETFDLFPTDPSVGTTVYGVPVTVKGNVGVGVEAGINMGLDSGRSGIGGFGRAWGYGRVGAQAGWSWFGAGVVLTATFANQRLEPYAAADGRNPFRGGPSTPTVSGRIAYTIQAIGLKLDVWVAFITKFTQNLVNWSSAKITIFDILF